jgi:hypothetical protein
VAEPQCFVVEKFLSVPSHYLLLPTHVVGHRVTVIFYKEGELANPDTDPIVVSSCGGNVYYLWRQHEFKAYATQWGIVLHKLRQNERRSPEAHELLLCLERMPSHHKKALY